MNIVTIHGAFSSKKSFNYIISNFPEYDWYESDYSEKIFGIDKVIEDLNNEIKYPSVLLGHSMGGIIASNLLTNNNVIAIITIASPLNGLNYPYFTPWIYSKKSFINELGSSSHIISNGKNNILNTKKQVYNVITSNGFNPFIKEENDGVISVASQIVQSFTYKFAAIANHHEVMIDPYTVELLTQIFKNIKNGE